MKASSVVSSLALLASSLVSASPVKCRLEKPAAFLLAGDSTTAIQSTGGGGWGNGFLATLTNGAVGTNYGHNGRTTVSFVAGGDWANVIADVKSKAAKYDTYVTIQFGHNDQKAAANISIAQFTANLENLGKDVRAAGGEPVFVTPLSRRNYDANGKIILNLADQVAATIVAAKAISANYIDLNKASVAYLEAIGLADATKYNLVTGDFTHLNAAGSVVFGNLVSGLLGKLGHEFKAYTVEDKAIKAAIKAGKFILPAV
ncbi:hypothetical protein VE00_09837 [Pseudogymnoascus sp. WSF 3629]|nr:hypothetical protein VE00_09837 [Pseudogymnoascus sp. WSF 3629]